MAVERQRHEVGDVGEQVQADDEDVPSASESGMFRRGSFTSPAVKVMLFQASAENSDPVCDTQTATNSPNAVTAETPGVMSENAARVPELPEVVGHGGLVPAEDQSDRRSSPTTAPILAVVKTFWTILPYSRPRVLVHVSSAMSRMPTSWAVESDSA